VNDRLGLGLEDGLAHGARVEQVKLERLRVLVPGGRLAFTTWLAQGNAEDEITEAALAAHAIAVEGPAGPSYHVFADRDECRLALARCGFDTGSLRMDTVSALWRVPSADFLSKHSSTPESAPPHPACAAARPARGHPRGDGRRCSPLRGRRGVRATDRRTPRLSSSVRPCR
jgi:hypothetical protein